MEHELAALASFVGGCDGDLDAELVGLWALPGLRPDVDPDGG